MTLALHAPGSTDSPLRHLDARWTIAAVAVAIVGNASMTTPPFTAAGAATALTLALAAKIPGRKLAKRLLPLVAMLTLFFGWSIFWPRPDEEPWTFAGLSLSPRATQTFLALVAKTTAIVTLIVTLLETTPLHELAQGAAGLGVPRLFIHLVLLTYRYIFVLGEEFSRLRRALRVRGYRSGLNRRSFATIGNVAGSLFVRGHERAERVHHAMTARGFDGVFRTMAAPRTKPADIAFFLVLSSATAVWLALDRGWLPL